MYCHHCGSKGFLRTNDKIRRADELNISVEPPTHYVSSMFDEAHEMWLASALFEDWPAAARIWWMSYELNSYDSVVYRARFHHITSKLLMYASVTCIQGRCFENHGAYKYTTYSSDKGVVSLRNGKNCAIIVEDLVSAFKIHKAGGDAVCLMGTKMNDETLNHIFRNYSRAIVWLDDDEAGKIGADRVCTRLRALLPTEIFIKQQPKEMPLSYLKGFVDV